MKYHTVNIEGWMPRDQDQHRRQVAKAEAGGRNRLVSNPSLSLQVSGMEPPRLVVDDEEDVVFGEREEGAVLCHHALLRGCGQGIRYMVKGHALCMKRQPSSW